MRLAIEDHVQTGAEALAAAHMAAQVRRIRFSDNHKMLAKPPAIVDEEVEEPEAECSEPVVPHVRDWLILTPPNRISTRANFLDCLAYVAESVGVRPEDITGPRRYRNLMGPRFVVAWLASVTCPHLSLVQIGRYMRRDHTTILHSVGRVRAGIKAGDPLGKVAEKCLLGFKSRMLLRGVVVPTEERS